MRLHTKGFTSIRWCARNLMKLLHRESLTQRTLATEDFDVAKSQFDTSFCRLTSISCQRVTFEISKRQLILRQFLTFDPNFIGKGFGWTFKIENSTPLSDVRPSFHERATPSFTKFAFHHTFVASDTRDLHRGWLQLYTSFCTSTLFRAKGRRRATKNLHFRTFVRPTCTVHAEGCAGLTEFAFHHTFVRPTLTPPV